ncbi:hypothetical protein HY633_00040 [Candidatus Uhrbacteria bacterium]|nr:hypothetical protein [Candidatus Uhrbacteria bacterium]
METLTSFLLGHAASQPLLTRTVEITTPILALARTGCYEQLRQLRFQANEAAAAISRAGVGEVAAIDLLQVPAPFSEGTASLVYGRRVDYMRSFAYRLNERRWPAIKHRGIEIYGSGGWGEIRDGIWARLKRDVGDPFKFTYWDDPEAAPRNTPGENLLTILFHLYAAAFAGDETAVADLEPTASNLDLWIPIGEENALAGHWVVVRAPSAVMVH